MICFAIDVTKVRVKPPKEKRKGVEASFQMPEATILMFEISCTTDCQSVEPISERIGNPLYIKKCSVVSS